MTSSIRVSRHAMARRAAADIPAGSVVNLGIGMPELVGNFLSPGSDIVVHTENGIVGAGPSIANPDECDFDLINAGRKPVSLVRGGHFVDHADSFALVRGGHLDITVLGAFEVSTTGDLANWTMNATDGAPSPGGAMDLAVGAKQVFVMMELFSKDGTPRLVHQCSLPLTACAVVKQLYTELAVFSFSGTGMEVQALVAGLTLADLEQRLGIPLAACRTGIGVYDD